MNTRPATNTTIATYARFVLILAILLALTGCAGQQPQNQQPTDPSQQSPQESKSPQESTNQQQPKTPSAQPTNTSRLPDRATWKTYHGRGDKYTISTPADFTEKDDKFGTPIFAFPETYAKGTNLKEVYMIVRLLHLDKDACIASHFDDKQPITAQAKIGDRTWYADSWQDIGSDAIKKTEALSVRENEYCYRIEMIRTAESMDKYRDASGALNKTAPKQYNDREILDVFIEIIKTFTTGTAN